MVDFIARINIRQIIIHFVATWLFVYAFYTLASLLDYNFLFLAPVNIGGYKAVHRIVDDKRMVNNMAFLGLAVAFVISLLITRKWKWGIANPIIVLLIIFVLKYYGFLGWTHLKNFFLFPGSLININSRIGIIINGGLMLIFGSYLFFLKDILRFIDRGNKNYEPLGNHKSVKYAGDKKK
jgi:hypothetical protein